MKRAIREHRQDFLAAAGIVALAAFGTAVIFINQGVSLPAWVPLLGTDRLELHAEFSTAQAVTPGQGQTVNIAGVRIGDITDVEVDESLAVVTMQVDERYAPLIHSDSSVLLRPRTTLQDMTIQLDPGSGAADPVESGATIPLAQTAPNVQPDELLSALDADTRSYLQLLVQAGGEGLGGNGPRLAAGLREFEPLAGRLKRIGAALAKRRDNVRSVVASLRAVSEELGSADTRLADFVTSTDAALGAFADQQASVRQAVRELPETLATTRHALQGSRQFAGVLAPASRKLAPVARKLRPSLARTRTMLEQTVPPLQRQIRPFAKAVRPLASTIAETADPLARAAQGLDGGFGELNKLSNALAYNPPGAEEEGYLFWLTWLAHDGNALFLNQDAQGSVLRAMVLQGCTTTGIVEGVTAVRPFLHTTQSSLNLPQSSDPRVCPPL